MKKFYYSLMVLAAAVMAVGCAEDFATNDAPQASVKEFIEVVANIECDAETRTTLLDNNGGKVMWSEGDAIGAIAADGTVTECVATSVNGTSATFSVPATTINAIYPYTTDFVDDHTKNRIGHRFVSNIAFDGSAKVFGDKQDVMVAALEDGAFAFKHVCGYIEIKLKGTGKVKHVALRGNTRKWDALSGLAYIDFNSLPEPTAAFSTGHKAAFNWLYATCDNIELSKSEATSFYFVVPPRTYENLSICVQTEEGSYAISSKNAITVNRAKIRPIAAIDIDEYKPATATNLSANGLANCYIVPQSSDAKSYSFPAQKINTTEKLANVAYAHLLWSDRAKLITNVSYDAATGTVSFKYDGGNKEGNAMISLLDANHNAIWTWHIWCTDQPQNVKIKTHVMLDRNLGATYAPTTLDEAKNITKENADKTLGLYYQYGRPIPFPAPTSLTNTTAESTSARFGAGSDFELMYGFKDLLQCFQYSTYQNTFASMLANPLIFCTVYFTNAYLAGTSTSATSYYAFCSDIPMPCTNNTKLWYAENADVVSAKGNTDPCPPGYCIDDFETFKAALYGTTINRIDQGNPESENTYGYSYQCPTTNQTIWFPANGFRTQNGVYSSVGSIANVWTVRACTYTNLYGIRWYTARKTDPTNGWYTSGINTLAWGFNVRCRAIDRTKF